MNINFANENVVGTIQTIACKKKVEKGKIFYRYVKRLVDIIGAIFGIILLLPLTIIVSIANIFEKDKGPVFYTQNRIGKNGKLFKMYKFRSMVIGADEILEEYLEKNIEAKEEYRINKKLKDDPRITKIGKIIRKTSIDEFPQFINILKGEMSLVGPRPYLPREREDMKDFYQCIISQKPGLTGLWQVSGRNDLTFEERLKLDKMYYEKRSIKIDFIILIKTFFKVFYKEGAV